MANIRKVFKTKTKQKEFGTMDTDKEAREYFEHNPETPRVHFIMVTDEDYDYLNEYGIVDVNICETVENEEVK
tara:strand:+ start:771 stop:989 length:219 start_codon:yes stop_codon:yes gene_type:complete